MGWLELSELAVGAVLTGKLAPKQINPAYLHPPYDEVLQMKLEGATDEDIAAAHFASFKAAVTAAEAASKLKLNEIEMLEVSYHRYEAGAKLQPIVKKLMAGEDADISKARTLLHRFEEGRGGLVPLSSIKPEKQIHLRTFYPPLDLELGGIQKAGLTICAGPPGTGKTSLCIRILSECTRNEKRVAFFSLEMTMAMIAYRLAQVSKLSKKAQDLFLITDQSYNIEDLEVEIERTIAIHPDLYMIAVDFADLLIEGEESTAKASALYRTLAQVAKRTEIPILLMAQLSGSYVGGLPRIHHLRWSRLAEAMASQILLIYNPDRIWADFGEAAKSPLKWVPNKAYLIIGKIRLDPKHKTVGAFLVDWNGASAWGNKSLGWFELAGGVS